MRRRAGNGRTRNRRDGSRRADGEAGVPQRLRDMGLLPGADVAVVGRSPLGDLLSLRVMGTTLALRLEDAARVTVSKEGEPAGAYPDRTGTVTLPLY